MTDYYDEQARKECERHRAELLSEEQALRKYGLKDTENFQIGDRAKPGLNWVTQRSD